MNIKDFIQARLQAIENACVKGDSVPELLIKGVKQVFLPFDVDGSPMEVGKLVPAEPIDIDFKTFNSGFMIQNGFINPVKTYRSDLGNVLNALTSEDVSQLLNPAPVEQKNSRLIMTKTIVGAPQNKRSTHNLSNPHYTTTDLFKIQPVFCREVCKEDNFNIKMAQINRVDNLPVSSFVEIENKHSWFYVKYNQVWKAWDAFKSKTPYAFDKLNNIPSRTPYFTLRELFAWFAGVSTNPDDSQDYTLSYITYNGVSHVDTTVDLISCAADRKWFTDHEVDFIYVGNIKGYASYTTDQAGVVGLTLNSVGRLIYSLMYALGYRIPSIVIDETSFVAAGGSTTQIGAIKTHIGIDNYGALHTADSLWVDALPLMAYLSILLNYYVPTKFRDYSFFNSLTYLPNPIYHLASGIMDDYMYDSNYKVFRGQVNKLLMQVFYGSDYFTDSLTSPYGDVLSGGAILDPIPSTNPVSVNQGTYSVPRVLQNSASTQITLNNYILATLQAIGTKAQIRALTKNNLLSSMLQQFGIKPESADMIPYKLYDHRDSIDVSPITALAGDVSAGDTGVAPIGYKAGEGHGKAIHEDSFEFDNYGVLICVNAIAPVYGLADGINREMLHTTPDDFLDPALVNLGYQGVGNCEVTINPDNSNLGSDPAFLIFGSFGFQNKFAELGYPKYSMGGDFVINSVSNGMDSFHFNRKFDLLPPSKLRNDNVFALGKLPVLYTIDYGRFESQYDRIFDVDDPNYDHIQQWTYFKILAHRNIPANGEFTVGDWNKNEVEGNGVMDNLNQ